MKKNELYISPEVEVVSVAVEKGFEGSYDQQVGDGYGQGDNAPDL